MATEAAHLFVRVTADTDQATKNISNISNHATKSGGIIKSALGTALGFGAATLALAGFGNAMGLIKGGAIDMNAQLETSTLQFTTLMGDADKARKHVEGLFDFAAHTPFETGPVIEASRMMETFGGSALNTKKNLTSFGNAAAAVSAPINEVSFWMSRAYAAIQAGKPWGEAAQRLGEMGIVTPQVRSKLEDLQKHGAKGPAVWGALTASLGKFDGAMERQSHTFDGMMSTFMDGINMTLAKALFPLFEGLKHVLEGVNAFMASDMFNGAIASIGAGISATFGAIADAIGALVDVFGPLISAFGYVADVIVSGEDVASGLNETIGNLIEKFSVFGDVLLSAVTGALESMLKALPAFGDAVLEMASGMIDAIVSQGPAFLDAILGFINNALSWVMETGVPLAATAIGGFALKFIDWVGPAAEKLAAALPGIAEKLLTFLADNLPIIMGKLAEWGLAFIGWIATNVLPRLPGALAAIAGALFSWLAGVASSLIAKAGDMGRGFVDNVINFFKALPGRLVDILGQVLTAIGVWGQKMGKTLGDIAINAGKSFANGIIGLIEGAINAVIRGLNSFQIHFDGLDLGPLGKVAAVNWNGFQLGYVNLPRFRRGTMDTGPKSILSILDPHEMVLPRPQAQAYRQGSFRAGQSQGDTFVFHIGTFQGTEEGIARMSEAVAARVRLARPKRTVVAG